MSDRNAIPPAEACRTLLCLPGKGIRRETERRGLATNLIDRLPGKHKKNKRGRVLCGNAVGNDRKSDDLELGPVTTDVVRRGDGRNDDLLVLSSRTKAHWNPYMTIRFECEFYQI